MQPINRTEKQASPLPSTSRGKRSIVKEVKTSRTHLETSTSHKYGSLSKPKNREHHRDISSFDHAERRRYHGDKLLLSSRRRYDRSASGATESRRHYRHRGAESHRQHYDRLTSGCSDSRKHYRDRRAEGYRRYDDKLISGRVENPKHYRDRVALDRSDRNRAALARSESGRHYRDKTRYENPRHHRVSSLLARYESRRQQEDRGTVAHHRDRRFHVSSNSDPFLKELTEIVLKKMKNLDKDYDGSAHVSWVGNLCYQKSFITKDDVNNYIEPLFLCIDTIQHWDIESCTRFYSTMTNLNFFSQGFSLEYPIQKKIYRLHNDLINKIITDLDKIPVNNTYVYIDLLSALARHALHPLTKNSKLLEISLFNKIAEIFLQYEGLLSVHQYKEIIFYFKKLNSIDENKINIDRVTGKILQNIIEIDVSEKNNQDLMRFFLLIISMKKGSVSDSELFKNNLLSLINKINFTSNVENASMGITTLKNITKNEVFSSIKLIKDKLDECFSYLIKNKHYLNPATSFYVIKAISDLSYQQKETSSPRCEMLDFCLNSLVKKETTFTFKELILFLRLTINPFIPEIYRSESFNISVNILLNIKETLFDLRDKELHELFLNFSKVLNKFNYVDFKLDFERIEFLLDNLTVKYAQTIHSANLSQLIDIFISLSNIASKGFQPSENTKKILKVLFNKIEQNMKNLSDRSLVYFIHFTHALGELIDLDITKYTELLIELSNKFSSVSNETKSKISLLWSLLVFHALKKDQLEITKKMQLKKSMEDLYQSIDKTSISELAHHTLLMAECELNKPKSDLIYNKAIPSQIQEYIYHKLKEIFFNLDFDKECLIKNLPPCDIAIPSKNIVIEVQGLHHYIDKERKIKTGATALKIELLKEKGCEVIEVHVGDRQKTDDSIKDCIAKIKALTIPAKLKFS